MKHWAVTLKGSEMADEKRIYLSTGIKHLDDLLSQDRPQKKERGGILIGKGTESKNFETPVVVIEGETGTGKTTLALQIAHSAARHPDWIVFYYSLEQTTQSLITVSKNFGYFPDEEAKKQKDKNVQYRDISNIKDTIDFIESNPSIFFCKLSPRPITFTKEHEIFEHRVAELNHVLLTINESIKNKFVLMIIDGITAFSESLLQRTEIYRLFTLFRTNHIPCIMTLERYSNIISEREEVSFECTKFLADIVISLTKDTSTEYLQYFLEIIKSRVERQALGKHLYKIRTGPSAENIKTDPRRGIVVYPSIHYVLSRVRELKKETGREKLNFQIDNQKEEDLGLILFNTRIKQNSCIAIIGPNGTHKLALGLNLAIGHQSKKRPKLLIINFGGTTEFGFNGVAWTSFNKKWRNLIKVRQKDTGSRVKFWHTKYTIKRKGKLLKDPIITITAFKIGQLTPEESFDVIDAILSEEENREKPFTSVLLNNTAELSTGFPLLKNEPLFLPTLIDLFKVHQLVSVCLGVEDVWETTNRLANFTLLANADIRIVLSHYPNMESFSKTLIDYARGESSDYLEEQLVSLIVDNVTGKHYRRHPRWLKVDETQIQDNKPIMIAKILHCYDRPEKVVKSSAELYKANS